jgi:hypothetical protein
MYVAVFAGGVGWCFVRSIFVWGVGILYGYLSIRNPGLRVYGLICAVDGRVDMFSFIDLFVGHTSAVICRMLSTTEDTSNITRSFFTLTLDCRVSFGASRFEITIVSCVPIPCV